MDNPDRLRVMGMILDEGVDPNFYELDVGGISGLGFRGTPLYTASKRGDVEVVKLLQERGVRDEIGRPDGLLAR